MVKSDVLGLQPSLSGCSHLQSAHLHFHPPAFSCPRLWFQVSPGGILPLPSPPSAPGTPPPSFSPGLEPWLCPGLWLHSQQEERRDFVAAPRSAVPGWSGSWEAPGAHLVCPRAGRGRVPSALSRIPRALGCPLGRGCCSWGWAVAGAGALPWLWGRAGGEPELRWVCVRHRESREGRMEAAQGLWVIPMATWDHHSFAPLCTVPAPVPVPFHFGGPEVPPPDRFLSLNPSLLFLPVPSRPVPHPQ